MAKYRYLGYGTTDNNGIAKLDHDDTGSSIAHSYTGTGAGEIDVVASLDEEIVEGSIVSEIYEIIDAIFFDDATSDKSSRFTKYRANVAFDGDKYKLSRNADGQCYIDIAYTGSAVNDLLGQTIRFECDIINSDAEVRLSTYRLVNGSWQRTDSVYASNGTLSVPSSAIGGVTIEENATAVQFRLDCGNLNNNEYVPFRNIKLYIC